MNGKLAKYLRRLADYHPNKNVDTFNKYSLDEKSVNNMLIKKVINEHRKTYNDLKKYWKGLDVQLPESLKEKL